MQTGPIPGCWCKGASTCLASSHPQRAPGLLPPDCILLCGDVGQVIQEQLAGILVWER